MFLRKIFCCHHWEFKKGNFNYEFSSFFKKKKIQIGLKMKRFNMRAYWKNQLPSGVHKT